MASPSHASPQRQSTTKNNMRQTDVELSQSLRRLSLSNESVANSPHTPKHNTLPFRPPANRVSPSPNAKIVSRSPSIGRDSGFTTPTLLRKASTSSLRSVNGGGHGQPPSCRSSSAQIMSPLAMGSSEAEVLPPTASSVAKDYFTKELELLHGVNSSQPTQVMVFVHDACYGHRYSRPRTSRSNLSTVVERPERIKASVVGLAMAYVRLGERHAEGAYPVHPRLKPTSIPNLPFRIRKTTRRVSLMSPVVTNVHGTKWMEELEIMCSVAESKLASGGKELQRPEMNRGLDAGAPPKLHEGDLYLCAESLEAFEGALGAVCDAVDTVFSTGPRRAFVPVRPPGHHCSASYPSGFCWINNVHVGIMHASLNHGLTHAAIIDFDLHHGDGSQSIAWQHNSRGNGLKGNSSAWKRTSIGYFSVHDINSYPCELGDEEKVKNASLCIDNAHGQTIWNVHLQPWKTEAEFWQLYQSKYSILLDKTRSFLKSHTERLQATSQRSKAAIFLSAGFDASEWESSGMQRHNVNVPTEFYARLTQDVIRIAAEEGTSVEGRIVSVLEGGYSDRALRSGIFSHLSGLVGEQPLPSTDRNGLGYEMGQRLGGTKNGNYDHAMEREPSLSSLHMYDPTWWSSAALDSVEAAMTPPPELKKPRHVTPPTYSSPTQASSAKVVAPKLRRSLSGYLAKGTSSPMSISRAPSPPPPEVPWTVAVVELSKLLIPTNRQTDSCTHEDLNVEATRARRQSILDLASATAPPAPVVPSASSRMGLRERKPAKVIESIEEDEEKLAKNRRKTVPSAAALTTEKAAARGIPAEANVNHAARRQSRRLSATSTILSTATDAPIPQTNGSDGISRPGSAGSVRPESSMSVRTQNGTSLGVKKTRTVNPTKKDVPKAPRTSKKTTAASSTQPTSRPAPPLHSASFNGRASDKASDDIDQITNGMKKIKINLITPKMREEAREKEAAEREAAEKQAAEKQVAEKQGAAEKKSPTPVVTPSTDESRPIFDAYLTASAPPSLTRAESIDSMSSTAYASTLESTTEVSTPVQAHFRPAVSPDPRQVPLPSSSPVVAKNGPATPDTFIHFQPEGPTPVPVARNPGALTWMPVNSTGTPTPSPIKKSDLPVFTPTSAISFTVPYKPEITTNGGARPDIKKEPAPTSVWDIPDSPEKK